MTQDSDVDVKDREDVDNKDDPLDSYEGKWKNLFFLYTGETFTSIYIHDTEEECNKHGAEVIASCSHTMPISRLADVHEKEVGRMVYNHEVHRSVAMPVNNSI